MDHFDFRDGILHCDGIDLRALADEFGTPLYVYAKRTLLDHVARFRAAFTALDPTICFSVKSCSNLSIMKLLREAGCCFDVVSGGELQRALEAGVDPAQIVFAGVGKTDAEIAVALDVGIGWFNVESPEELRNLATIAASNGQTARVALRVNPDVDPHTHEYTTTGKRETKFGIAVNQAGGLFAEYASNQAVELAGIHVHIGSPVNTVQPYVDSVSRTLELIDRLREEGHTIRALNIGGGFGAHYDGDDAPPASAYAERIVPLLSDRDLEILFEPGRCIAANAGVLLTRTLLTKRAGDKRYIVVDAAITELIRPALYGSFHFAWPVAPAEGLVPPDRRRDLRLDGTSPADIVGPVCESGDFLAKDRNLPPVSRGDLIAVFSAGAYGMSMSSQYNSRCRAAEVLVDGADVRLIRRRETYDDLVATERV